MYADAAVADRDMFLFFLFFYLTVIADFHSFCKLYAVNLNVLRFIYLSVKFNYYPRFFCSALYSKYVQTYK